MASGMAHISGGMMVVYINYGARPRCRADDERHGVPVQSISLETVLPETGTPVTAGSVEMKQDRSPYVNAIDAAAAGHERRAASGANVAAMLIVFIAFVAMFNGMLREIKPRSSRWASPEESLATWPDDLSLGAIFGWLFARLRS